MTTTNGDGTILADNLRIGNKVQLAGIDTPVEVRTLRFEPVPGSLPDDYNVEVEFEAGGQRYELVLTPEERLQRAVPDRRAEAMEILNRRTR